MAETIYYVDPDVSGGAGDGSSWANAYSSLNAAEQARNADITAGNAVVFSCRSSAGTADTASTNVNGWVTDADSYVRVVCESGNRHSGVWDTSKYRLEVSNAIVLQTNEDYVRVEGLQLKKTSSSVDLQPCLYLNGCGPANDVWFSDCICVQAGNNTYSEPGIFIDDGQAIASIWNCICYGGGSYATTPQGAALAALSATTVRVYSCTLIGNAYGMSAGTGVPITAKNCYAVGSSGAYVVAGAGVITQTTCAAADATAADATLDNIAYSTANFISVTPGNADYLKLVTGSALIDVGTDTSGESAPLNFTTDIAGTTRTGTWDIGAFEYVSMAGITASAQDAITVTDAALQIVGNRVSAFEYTGSDTLASSNW